MKTWFCTLSVILFVKDFDLINCSNLIAQLCKLFGFVDNIFVFLDLCVCNILFLEVEKSTNPAIEIIVLLACLLTFVWNANWLYVPLIR